MLDADCINRSKSTSYEFTAANYILSFLLFSFPLLSHLLPSFLPFSLLFVIYSCGILGWHNRVNYSLSHFFLPSFLLHFFPFIDLLHNHSFIHFVLTQFSLNFSLISSAQELGRSDDEKTNKLNELP